MSSVSRRCRIAIAAGASVILAPLATISPSSALAADPVDISLLNTNDFHGRIDADTTKYATTIEQLRAEEGDASTLFLSAGDNIGASLFASSSAQDVPTIEVLNALDLAATAVGNHEFDQGIDDLDGRVSDLSDFPLLGANVYNEGTTDPVLQEFETFEVNGVTVGVVGVVTQGTPSAVSPDGIEGLEFGDPVEAVNRVAARLSDGRNGNGEADVIVAEYHEGGPEAATLAEATATSPTFDSIVNETAAEVDAIFTAHTHSEYTYDGQVPGEPGETRPILQTGQYGDNIGQIVLSVEPATGEVTTYTQRNVPRAEEEDLSFPRVAEVKEITDAARDAAAELGNQPVGEITDDITTAFSGGDYGPDGYQGGDRDDRRAESSLGGLVANALRDGVEGETEPDFGVTNPGGLRDELTFAAETEGNPENTDGVVTFSEANEVLPFGNTVALVELTGAQFKQVLEQQWQTQENGELPEDGDEPYLQLGMSDNLRVTADPTNPAGSRITSVRVDGEPLDPTRTYTVSTLSFLAQGGDNFRAFADGESVDTGLLDAQMFRDYIAANSPLSPDFARQQVFTDGMPATVVPGQSVQFDLGRPTGTPVEPISGTTLDLTSLGSPANTAVTATLVDGESESGLGEFDVTDGVAAIDLSVPATAGAGAVIEMVAQPSGTTVSLPVGAAGPGDGGKAESNLRATKKTKRVVVDRTRTKIKVTVRSEGDAARGRVEARVGGKTVGKRLDDGKATLRLKKFAKPGRKSVRVVYLGNKQTERDREVLRFRVRRR